MGSGFEGDQFEGQRYFGVYEGRVVDRDDPDLNGRIRIQIPGLIDERSAWARPRGGGSKNWGMVKVPPLHSDVLVQFINGNIDRPIYEPFDYGVPEAGREMFPEHDHPDVIVAGFGPFRLVIDLKEGVEPSLMVKQVAQLADGSETDTAWFLISENSVQSHGDSAAELHSGGITSVDSEGDVQVKGRKMMPVERPVS